jgi:hypothetical protein
MVKSEEPLEGPLRNHSQFIAPPPPLTQHSLLTLGTQYFLSCNSLETINRLPTHLEALNGPYRRGDRNPTSDPRNVRGAS